MHATHPHNPHTRSGRHLFTGVVLSCACCPAHSCLSFFPAPFSLFPFPLNPFPCQSLKRLPPPVSKDNRKTTFIMCIIQATHAGQEPLAKR